MLQSFRAPVHRVLRGVKKRIAGGFVGDGDCGADISFLWTAVQLLGRGAGRGSLGADLPRAANEGWSGSITLGTVPFRRGVGYW